MDERNPRLSRHIKDRFSSFEQLGHAAVAVESLLAHSGWQVVRDLLGDEIANIDAQLDDQPVPMTQAEYALAHGRRGGLKAAESVASLVIARYAAEFAEQQRKHEAEPAGSGSER